MISTPWGAGLNPHTATGTANINSNSNPNTNIMANFSIKTDLLKIKGAFVTNFQGKTTIKRCLCIPIDESGLFLGKKGVYLNMTAIEMQHAQFEDSHCIKVAYDKEVYEKMSEEERKTQPIIGGLRQIERKVEQMPVTTTTQAAPGAEDDLPF